MRPYSLATVQGLCSVLAALQNCWRLGPGRAQNMTPGSGRGLGPLQSLAVSHVLFGLRTSTPALGVVAELDPVLIPS